MTWPTVKLGEITKIRTGKLDANAANENGIYPFFTCAVEPLSINTAAFDCKAILVAGNGDLNVKYYEGKFNAYQRTYVIESLDENKLLPKYLFLFLEKYVGRLRELAIGGVIKYIKIGNLTDAELPLPPLAEQQRIAAILDKAEEIRRKREQAIAKLDELAQSTFLDMFGDPNVNHLGFEICKIGDLLESANYGTSEKSSLSGTHPVLRMNNITASGELDLTNLKYMDLNEKDFDKYLAKYGDILFNRTNSPELVGKSALFDITQPYAFAGYLIRLRANSKTEPAFIAGYLNTKYAKRTLRNMCKSIIGMANINAKEIQAMSIPKPSLTLQTQYKNKVFTIKKMKEIHQRALKVHVDLALTLQHQAFTTGFNA